MLRHCRPARRRPFRTGLALVICLLTTSVSCGGQGRVWFDKDGIAGTTIRFALGLQPDEAQAVAELVKKFEDETKTGVNLELFTRFRDQGGAKVTLNPVTSSDLPALLRKGGSGIQLFAQDNGELADLVREHLVQEISDVWAEVEPEARASAPAPFNGERLFLPFRPNVRLAYANKEALHRAGVGAPRTLADLAAVAQKLLVTERRPMVTLSLSAEDGGKPTAVTISELVLAFGGDPRQVADAGSIKAFEYLQGLAAAGVLARESFFAKHDTEITYLEGERTALAENWSVTSAQLAKAGKLGEFEVYDGWQGPKAHVVGGDVLGIPMGVTGKERRAAKSLVRFLLSKESQAFLVRRNAWPAIRADAYELVGGDNDTIAAARRALEEGWYRPSQAYWADVTKAMNEAVERIVRGFQPVEPVLRELRQGIERQYGADYVSKA